MFSKTVSSFSCSDYVLYSFSSLTIELFILFTNKFTSNGIPTCIKQLSKTYFKALDATYGYYFLTLFIPTIISWFGLISNVKFSLNYFICSGYIIAINYLIPVVIYDYIIAGELVKFLDILTFVTTGCNSLLIHIIKLSSSYLGIAYLLDVSIYYFFKLSGTYSTDSIFSN